MSNKSIENLITKANYKIFNLINALLTSTDNIEMFQSVTESFMQILEETVNEADTSKEVMLNNINKIKTGIIEEFQGQENVIENLCYLIGTNSEMPDNYTLVSRVSIILAIAEIMELKLDF